MNEEAIKKYQQTHDPYKQLKEVVEKNGTKYTGGNGAEPMSTLEKELLETYEERFGDKNHVMLKSGRYQNDGEKSPKCECTDINNMKLTQTKGKDKYLKHLKHRCIGGICSFSVGSALLTLFGLYATKAATYSALAVYPEVIKNCISSTSLFYMIDSGILASALKATATCASAACPDVLTPAATATCASAACPDVLTPAATAVSGIFHPCGITALVLLILAVVLIILYIWLYRRRKRSWKHECKKHLCK